MSVSRFVSFYTSFLNTRSPVVPSLMLAIEKSFLVSILTFFPLRVYAPVSTLLVSFLFISCHSILRHRFVCGNIVPDFVTLF